jgi:two-component system phosphate regulon sensor histidine kinase PhoR
VRESGAAISRPAALAKTSRIRRRSGAARSSARLALGVLVVLLAGALATGAFAIVSLYRSAESRYVQQALPLRTATRDIVLQMVNEETGVRGYLITRDRASLRPYFDGRFGVANDLAALSEMARTHPELAVHVRRLRGEIRALNGWFARQIAFTADGRAGQLRAQRNVLGGQALFGRFRKTAAATADDANRLVAQTRAAQRRTYRRTLAALVAGGAGALVIALWLLVRVPERLRRIYAAEEEARTEAELGANAARALEHINEAVILLDEDGTIQFWNAGASELFQTSARTAVESAAEAVVPDLESLEQAASRGRAVMPALISGRERWLRVAIASFEGGRVLTLRDVTDEHDLERARADLIATASHELRTPVAAVYGAVETLRGQSEISEEQRNALMQVIEQEAERLAALIEQILLTAELDRGATTVDVRDCDVYALCSSVRQAAESGANRRVTLRAPAAIGSIRTDPERLRQVLTNLVDNAIKYSPDDSTVEIRIEDDPQRIRINVSDEGIGIPAAEQERIFEKFYRVDAAMTGGIGGSGLGLYISRELIERLGGRLTVKSRPGSGSTFTVALPRT